MKCLFISLFALSAISVHWERPATGQSICTKAVSDSHNNLGHSADSAVVPYYLFSYFKGEDKGMCYALSTDGLHWKVLNKGEPVLVPRVGTKKLMRDPSIRLGVDGIYRVVWTTDWKGENIGYAYSKDLIHWSNQQLIPVGKKLHGTNSWAPEIFYDDLRKKYMILWSTQVGPWSSANGVGSIYYVTTTDFKTFSDPQILFSNGSSAGGKAGDNGPIDAFIFRISSNNYLLFYKKDDNTGIPDLFYRRGVTATGPWQKEMGPVLPSTGDEGPSVIKVGDEYHVYTDPFESDSAYVFVTKDFEKWERRKTDLKMSHGTVIQIPASVAGTLLKNEE